MKGFSVCLLLIVINIVCCSCINSTSAISHHVSSDKTSLSNITSVPVSENFILPGLIGNNMVLQRNSKIKLWGNYSVDGELTAEINGKTYTGECKNGYFEIEIITGDEIEPFDLTIFNKIEKIVIKNVVLGEVYLCAGQSNMQIPMQYINAPELFEKIAFNHIRFVNVPVQNSVDAVTTPTIDVPLKWEILFNSTLPSFSAVAYYFGEEMFKNLKVPIGIIWVAAGDTIIASWLPTEDAKTISTIYQEERPQTHVRTASHMFYTMISPILQYKVRGVIWYQGENQPFKYDEYLTKLINVWRREFNSNLEFTIIQLPGLDNSWNEGWPEIRDAQRLVTERLSDCALSINIDCGEKLEIHPKDKKPIGVRAANATLSKFFNLTDLPQSSRVQRFSSSNNKFVVEFNNADDGLILKNDGKGFEISSNDVFYPAIVTIENNRILLSNPAVINPTKARYAYLNWPSVSLFNKSQMPAEPFNLEIR